MLAVFARRTRVFACIDWVFVSQSQYSGAAREYFMYLGTLTEYLRAATVYFRAAWEYLRENRRAKLLCASIKGVEKVVCCFTFFKKKRVIKLLCCVVLKDLIILFFFFHFGDLWRKNELKDFKNYVLFSWPFSKKKKKWGKKLLCAVFSKDLKMNILLFFKQTCVQF